MAAKGSAAKSSSGAAMSKYDVEVEARLKAIEAELKSLRTQCDAHSNTSHSGGGGGEKVEELWQWYQEAKKHV